jgi:hypothetical protein
VNAREVWLQGAEDSDTAAYRTTRYTVYPSGFSQVSDPERRHWLVRVEGAGDGWAIRWRTRCLNYRNVWEFEPSPKSRTDEFLQRCRFSERAALLRAKKAVNELQVDGMTYEEFVHQVRAGAASKARTALEAADSPSLADADGIAPVLPLRPAEEVGSEADTVRLRRCDQPLRAGPMASSPRCRLSRRTTPQVTERPA